MKIFFICYLVYRFELLIFIFLRNLNEIDGSITDGLFFYNIFKEMAIDMLFFGPLEVFTRSQNLMKILRTDYKKNIICATP